MTIITGLIGLLGRFAGKLLNTTLGWATVLLFGKVPQNRQILLLGMVFGSIVWVVLVIGVLVPEVGLLLLAAVPLPDFVDETWVRLAMLAGAIFVPMLIGLAAYFLSDGQGARKPGSIVSAIVRGYPFALVLTLVLGLLLVIATVRKVRSLSKRWQDAHVAIIVKPGAYDAVLSEVSDTLARAGLEHTVHDAGTLLAGPPKLLDLVAGRSLGALVPDRLMLLAANDFEVLVYPSDLAISGTKENVARARAALASRVGAAPAYLTTTAEAQDVEDRLEQIREQAAHGTPAQTIARLRELDETLKTLAVPYDEWEVLYRVRLQLERDALRAMGEADASGQLVADDRRPSRLEVATALGGIGLIAADVALLAAENRRTRRR